MCQQNIQFLTPCQFDNDDTDEETQSQRTVNRMQATLTILLLITSNVFMTMAWYGHLRFRSAPLWEVIIISWLIAFLEYCFQVPANRIGSYEFTAAQLKIIQEVITLVVFGAFSVLYLKQQFQWNYAVAFALIVGAVFFVFIGNGDGAQRHEPCKVLAPPNLKQDSVQNLHVACVENNLPIRTDVAN